ncbi:TetR/AcrR family transcriptional regulator [Mycobacteroides salmoniphilum]|uniref:TetR/AcrR family transcriptional regulator n=1 Tax=Mycobacteroides salmoniphilum TaxID=404941 RepID=UPI0009932399|nr:TetR/AcrR family transcriptional regulator [Mycobacteroides salmoniphilum]
MFAGMPSQVERSAATQAALKRAGRELFTEQGYAAVSTQALVDRAGVSRGPLYHQFGDKLGLFTAVFADIENEIAQHVVLATADLADDPIGAIRAGMSAFLDAVSSPSILRIAVLEAPAALGWQAWHERGERVGFAMLESLLARAIERGQMPLQPARPLAHIIVGSAIEAASYLSRAEDSPRAKKEIGAVIDRLITSFCLPQ